MIGHIGYRAHPDSPPEPAPPAPGHRITPDNAPQVAAAHERMQLRAAAFRVTKLYPGIVGDVLADDLLAAEQIGFRLANGSRLAELTRHALNAPLPAAQDWP